MALASFLQEFPIRHALAARAALPLLLQIVHKSKHRVCTEHSARSKTTKDSTYTYHYRKGACCTCSATTTPVTPYCAQSSIPSCTLRISRQRCTRIQTLTYQRNAKKALCMLLLLYPQMSTHQCTNVCTVSKHKKHTMHYRCTNAALAVLPPFATTGSPSFNLCPIHNVQLCTEL